MNNRNTRREILTGALLAAAAGAASSSSCLAAISLRPGQKERKHDTLIVVFLRGGADGLNIVPPYFEDDYYRLRPLLSLARPNDRRASPSARALDLDGKFGLHPAMASLLPLYKDGKLAAVHAVGSGDTTRSHFEAVAAMETGNSRNVGASSGWLARYLTATANEADSPLRTVAITDTMPDSLRGAPSATALLNLSDYKLTVPGMARKRGMHPAPERSLAISESLRNLYGSDRQGLSAAGKNTLDALDAVKRLAPAQYRPRAGVTYPNEPIGMGLKQAACLIKGRVGLEVACMEMQGWDTHVTQGKDIGFQPARLRELGGSLSAFCQDIGSQLENVTVVVMTEFGRRAYENTGLGTDHGRGGAWFVIGGGVRGGHVYTKWPGLSAAQLDGGNDLKVTTDYRDVLADVLIHRMGATQLSSVFPEHSLHLPELAKPV
jgi:uncharacterized protein (DUF1501 family)